MQNSNFFIFCYIIFSLFFVISCTPSAPSPSAEPNAEEVIIDSGTPCPISTPEVFELPEYTPKFVYVLIDKSGSYQEWTKASLDMLFPVFSEIAKPGDLIYLSWIGNQSNQNQIVFFNERLPSVEKPIFNLYPSYPVFTGTPEIVQLLETATPKILTDTQKIELTHKAQTESAKASETQFSIATADMQSINSYYCQVASINIENQLKAGRYDSEWKSIIENFLNTKLLPALDRLTPQVETNTRLYETLYYAGTTLQQYKRNEDYENVYLLIFSDMLDQSGVNPNALDISFEGVHVTVAMYKCEDAFQCQETRNAWNSYFISRGAVLPVDFIPVIETSPNSIIKNMLQGE